MSGKKTLLPFLLFCALIPQGILSGDLTEGKEAWAKCRLQGLALDADGYLRLEPGKVEGSCESGVLDAGSGSSIRFAAMVCRDAPRCAARLEFRASAIPFEAGAQSPEWQVLDNPSLLPCEAKPFFQYRIKLQAEKPDAALRVCELFLSTDAPSSRFANEPRPKLDELLMTMFYASDSEKLRALYGGKSLPFNASERGMYIFREAPGKPVDKSYAYKPRVDEMLLPMRYGTWILMRVHPTATFSPLGLQPSPSIMRSKDGKEKEAPRSQSASVNFFDESFMAEYETGIAKAVAFYRESDPKVVGYTLMPPEFFYDTAPWPEMRYLSGFGDLAFENYKEFMGRLGLNPASWPSVSDGDVCLDRDCYLWAYWRAWAGARSVSRLAQTVKKADPSALVGTMHYAGAQSLRGLEAAFVECDPNIDYYYSANMFPRVPGPDGFSGGKTFSLSRPNCLGRSGKLNLLEYDIWSPYVDFQRALTYARYARLDGIMPVPIVFGGYPKGDPPGNHLTKYHGMKGSPASPEALRALAGNIMESRKLKSGGKRASVALILPSFSLFSVLEKDRWLQSRLQQRSLELLESLLRLGVSFDLLTEGYAGKAVLDSYKLAIVAHPAFNPQLLDALAQSSANVLALGWAGSISSPGPKRLSLELPAREGFSLALRSAWRRQGASQTAIPLPGGGIIAERNAKIVFSNSSHPLLQGLRGLELDYSGRGLEGRGLPLAVGIEGSEQLAFDDRGSCCFSIAKGEGKSFIRFGAMLAFSDLNGQERSLFSKAEELRFFANAMDFCGVEYFPRLPDELNAVKTKDVLLLENISTRPYAGPVPRTKNGDGLEAQANYVEIPPLQSVVLPLGRSGETQGF